MAKITRKNAATAIKLSDLLRKRKMTLSKFITEFGLHSYESLKARCERIGVSPPDIDVYNKAKGPELVSSPTDGIIILDFPKVINEKTGVEINTETELSSESEMISEEIIEVIEPTEDEDVQSLEDNQTGVFYKKNKKLKNKWNNPSFQNSEFNSN